MFKIKIKSEERRTAVHLYRKTFVPLHHRTFETVMKKILLLSDTHSHIDDTILKLEKLKNDENMTTISELQELIKKLKFIE